MTTRTKTSWGFDTKNLDRNIRPQDDFYRFANGTFIKKTKIPPSESRWGSFTKLRHDTDMKLKTLLEELVSKKRLAEGSPEQLVRDLYRSGIDIKTREALKTKPLTPFVEAIASLKTVSDLTKLVASFERAGLSTPWAFSVDQDSKKSSEYALHFYQSGLGMPDRDYYLKSETEFLRVRKAYETYVEKMLKLFGEKEPENARRVVLEIETRLARVSMNKVDSRDADKTYHKKKYAELKTLAPHILWDSYFKEARIPHVPHVIVAQPHFLEGVSSLFANVPVEEWRTYFTWHLINSTAPLLSQAFVKTQFDFYGRTLSGSKKMRPHWRRALGAVNAGLGEALGKLYVERHFSTQAKKEMDRLVDDLFEAYALRIKELDWMSPSTKKKALLKLRLMGRKIGYPKKFKTYKGLIIRPNEYFENMLRINFFEHTRDMRKLKKKKIDRDEWHMSPQTVNAYCNFNMNEIVFPAAILQAPFFDIAADPAINYGAIGAVIGHEITHGFDDQGSKFDGHGNMKVWWTNDDRKRFEAKARVLATQYDGYTVVDGVPVNGKLTLGENIADLGGLSIAFSAYQRRLKKMKRENIEGFSPEQRFFLGAARAECELYRDEYLKMQALNDPHSPSEFRVNGPLQNMHEFYEAFNVTEGDKLFRKEKERVRIW